MFNDKEFLEFYKQLTGQTLTREGLIAPQNPASEFHFAPFPEAVSDAVTPRNPSAASMIVFQQLGQLDRIKSAVLNDLRNAETCGYRAARFVATETHDEVQTDFEPRRYVPTDRPFDWAIHGDGFFVLRKGESQPTLGMSAKIGPPSHYTRAGRFELTHDRKLALKHGGETYLLQPEIEIPERPGTLDIREGSLIITLPDGSVGNLSDLQLATFEHPERLYRIDGVLFSTGESPAMLKPSEPFGIVRMREYEVSNVDFDESLSLYRTLHRMQTAILETLP